MQSASNEAIPHIIDNLFWLPTRIVSIVQIHPLIYTATSLIRESATVTLKVGIIPKQERSMDPACKIVFNTKVWPRMTQIGLKKLS